MQRGHSAACPFSPGTEFTGPSLDTSKWVTYLGAEGARWNDNGYLPSPYSGPNMPGDGFHLEMYGRPRSP